jgi:hypothetical protein
LQKKKYQARKSFQEEVKKEIFRIGSQDVSLNGLKRDITLNNSEDKQSPRKKVEMEAP